MHKIVLAKQFVQNSVAESGTVNVITCPYDFFQNNLFKNVIGINTILFRKQVCLPLDSVTPVVEAPS